ncbi:hypothetical protein GQS65_04240 [Halomarina oriensis]|uniref:Uncharacterized protein n=1 Tax=Halomarina oriensis TaxID=671145 RepID=A0A6B0GJY7_9EURY|nr:hypothetical protein [Halomarina oriensis]
MPVGRDQTDLIGEVTAVELPDIVLDVVDEYERVLSDRDTFLWQWIHSLFDAFTLSSVDDRDLLEVKEVKTLFTVFITTLDDLIESHDDKVTFEEARRVVRDPDTVDPSREGVNGEVLAFIEDLWGRIDESLRAAPRYGEFKDIFEYDLRQGFNAMEYTRLVSDNAHIANATGARTYDAHNMVLFPYTDIDLMFSSGFALDDLSALRDLTWDLQKMARIGNWVTTWERELTEGDYSAGVIVQAIQDNVVNADELDPAGDLESIVERIKECGVEEAFLDEWCQRHKRVCEREYDIESVDVAAYIGGMETVMEYHLASRGMK